MALGGSSWPTLSSPRSPISVRRASPRCELCAQTTSFASLAVAPEVGDQRVERLGHVAVAQVPRRDLGPRTSCGSTPRRSRPAARSARRRTSRPRPPSRRGAGSRRELRCSSTSCSTTSRSHGLAEPEADGVARRPGSPRRSARSRRSARGPGAAAGDRPSRGRRSPPRSRCTGCRGRGRRSRPGVAGAGALVVGAQPADEVEHLGVPPHPGREALEAAQRLLRVARPRRAPRTKRLTR